MKWVSYTRSISSRIGEENPSNTIAEQNERIARYLKKRGCSVSEKYSDRKRTAEATEGFDKLVQDGMARKFDAVAVDSIFRCGRTLPFAIEALQRTFYPLGIQFAVVEDDFCSADKTAEEVAEYFNGKTIDKIRSEFITNRQNQFEEGTLTHRQNKYGYTLSEDSRGFVLDSESSYLRLSLADGDLKKGSKDESNSIENQRMLLHDYIGKQEDLFGEIVEYVDDGYTGTNFNRPAFQKMIVDLKQGDIKVIMVKDLSRLGRDYIGVGDYIEQIFPLMGVRFIAVNNSFDSMKLNNGTPGIEVAVSNLVNNMYSRDIAKKIRAALETNWKNGKATCTNVPFGYVWNKKGGQRWEIDPEAAACVKKVFELALSGRNTTQIAYGMNELNLPTPGLYAKRKNLLMGSNPIIAPDSEMLWNAAIVWRILRRYEYTGALVMGRRKKIDVNTTSVRTLPEDKWIIAENAHAAIVTKDEYYQAQKAIRNVTPIQYKVGDDFALKGKICCGNCNRQLRHERQYGEMVFYCGYKRSAGKFSKCYGGYYREYSVNAKVARAIKTVFYALDVVNQGMQEKQSITVRCMDIEDLEKQAEAIRVEQIKLYESYADGVLLRDAYIEKKKALSEKLAALQDSIRTEKEEQECADELDEEIRALTIQASEKTYIGGLTKECVDAFVSMVYLYDDQTMKIEFNCEDVIRRALEKYGA